MKKIFLAIVVLAMVYSNTLIIGANHLDEKYVSVTSEKPMPDQRLRSSMFAWKNQTSDYLEEFYDNQIEVIVESENEVEFIFYDKEIENIEFIKSVTYFKASQFRQVPGDYKRETLVEFSGVYNKNYARAANWNLAKSTFIVIFGIKYAISAVCLSLANMTVDYLNQLKPIDVQDREQYRYLRKVGFVYNNYGDWQPTVYVGQKETYTSQYINYYSSTSLAKSTITDWRIQTPFEIKANFNNHTWIENKAYEMYYSGNVYYDCFN